MHNMDRKWQQLLAQGKWLQVLPRELQARVLGALQSYALPANSTLFRQGDNFNGLYCVLSGQLHVKGHAQDGSPLLIAILRPGEWTGFLAALDGGQYAFSVSCVGESRIAVLDAMKVRSIFEADLATYKFLVQPELSSSRATYNYFIEHFGRPPLSRVAERLIGLGRWPYSSPGDDISPLDHVSQDLLAAATRLSRQTVNTCLKELERAGFVKTGYGKVEIVDIHGLAKITSKG
jgi:CRP-like cAMP-binding protein